MPRALKSDKFMIYAAAKSGPRKGQRFIGVNSGTPTLQEFVDFLKEQNIALSEVPLHRSFVVYTIKKD